MIILSFRTGMNFIRRSRLSKRNKVLMTIYSGIKIGIKRNSRDKCTIYVDEMYERTDIVQILKSGMLRKKLLR